MRNCTKFISIFFSMMALLRPNAIAQQTTCRPIPAQIPASEVTRLTACALEARHRGDLGEAIIVLRALSAAFPEETSPMLELAMTLGWAKKYGEAQEIYDRLLRTHPNLFPALMGQAWVTAWQGNSQLAANRFLKLVETNPEQVDAKVGLAFALRGLMRYEDARRLYREVLTTLPEHAGALQGLEALKYVANTDITLNTGRLTVSDGRHVEQQVAEMAHQLNRNLSFTTAAFRDIRTEDDGDKWIGGRLGIMLRLTEKMRTGFALFGSKGPYDHRYGVSFDVNMRATNSLTLMGTLRPGLKNGQDFEWTLGGGFLVQTKPQNYFLSQCFVQQLAGLPQSMTCSGTYKQHLGKRFSVQPTLVWHRPIPESTAKQILDVNLTLQFHLTPRLMVGANYGFGKGNTQRLGFGLRFRR